MNNIPEVKLGIIAVSRDCFPIALSTQRRKNIVAAYGEGLYECPITVENEKDASAAIADVKAHGVNALVAISAPRLPRPCWSRNSMAPPCASPLPRVTAT